MQAVQHTAVALTFLAFLAGVVTWLFIRAGLMREGPVFKIGFAIFLSSGIPVVVFSYNHDPSMKWYVVGLAVFGAALMGVGFRRSANLAEPARARLPIVVAFLISVGIPLLLGYFISPEIREWIFKGFVVVFVAALAAPFVIYAVYYVRYRLHQRRKRRSTNVVHQAYGLAGAFC